jgi:hypothetical protein
MVGLHSVIGFAMIAVNGLAAALGAVYLRMRHEPRRGYVHVLALAQTLVVAQAAIGLLLLAGDRRAVDKLHYLYGGVALAAALSPWLYAPRTTDRRLFWFTGATAVAAALGVRALITGG